MNTLFINKKKVPLILSSNNICRCKHGKVDISLFMPSLIESDSILCSNFEFCERRKSETFKKHIDLQIQAIYDDPKRIPRKVYIF